VGHYTLFNLKKIDLDHINIINFLDLWLKKTKIYKKDISFLKDVQKYINHLLLESKILRSLLSK